MQCEGGDAKNNPFNTTQKMPRSWNYNDLGDGIGVQNYASAQEGLEAMMKTLDSGHAYDSVDAALKTNRPARVTIRLIGESPWGTARVLLVEVLAWVARVPGVLKALERKKISP